MEQRFKDTMDIMQNLKNAQNIISDRAWQGLMRFKEISSQITLNDKEHKSERKSIEKKSESSKTEDLTLRGFSTPSIVERESEKHTESDSDNSPKQVKMVNNLSTYESNPAANEFF